MLPRHLHLETCREWLIHAFSKNIVPNDKFDLNQAISLIGILKRTKPLFCARKSTEFFVPQVSNEHDARILESLFFFRGRRVVFFRGRRVFFKFVAFGLSLTSFHLTLVIWSAVPTIPKISLRNSSNLIWNRSFIFEYTI